MGVVEKAVLPTKVVLTSIQSAYVLVVLYMMYIKANDSK